jgi:hypothetical protein
MSGSSTSDNRRTLVILLALCVVTVMGVALFRRWAAGERRRNDARTAGLIPPGKSDGSPLAPPPGSAKPPVLTRPLDAAESAVITPLAIGSTIEGFRINNLQSADAGHLSLLLSSVAQPTSAFELQIYLAGSEGPPAPAVAGRYAIYYKGSAESTELTKAIAAVAQIIGKNDAPAPPGMTTYKTD